MNGLSLINVLLKQQSSHRELHKPLTFSCEAESSHLPHLPLDRLCEDEFWLNIKGEKKTSSSSSLCFWSITGSSSFCFVFFCPPPYPSPPGNSRSCVKTVFSGGVRDGQAQVQGQAALMALFRIPLLRLQEQNVVGRAVLESSGKHLCWCGCCAVCSKCSVIVVSRSLYSGQDAGLNGVSSESKVNRIVTVPQISQWGNGVCIGKGLTQGPAAWM